MSIILPFYLTYKLIDLVISIVSPLVIPYLGFFSYGHDMFVYNTPYFVRLLTNFDGIFYIRIAMQGYSDTEQAYFPLYPLLIKGINVFIQNPIYTGALISNAAFIVGLFVFKKYVKRVLGNPKTAVWPLIFLLAYPTSYYFGVLYNESVFFLLLVCSLYFTKQKNYALAFIAAYLAGLTKVIGMFLCVPLGIMLIGEIISQRSYSLKKIMARHGKHALICAAPIIGMATYSLYLWYSTGDPLYFFHAQEDFGANRSSHLITPLQVVYRYIKIFVTADKSFQYYVAISEFVFYLFTITLLVYDFVKQLRLRKKNIDRIALNAFSFANVLVPSLTGTLTAVPRYTLMSLSLFFVLSEIENKHIRYAILALFALAHIVMFSLFIQGYYVT